MDIKSEEEPKGSSVPPPMLRSRSNLFWDNMPELGSLEDTISGGIPTITPSLGRSGSWGLQQFHGVDNNFSPLSLNMPLSRNLSFGSFLPSLLQTTDIEMGGTVTPPPKAESTVTTQPPPVNPPPQIVMGSPTKIPEKKKRPVRGEHVEVGQPVVNAEVMQSGESVVHRMSLREISLHDAKRYQAEFDLSIVLASPLEKRNLAMAQDVINQIGILFSQQELQLVETKNIQVEILKGDDKAAQARLKDFQIKTLQNIQQQQQKLEHLFGTVVLELPLIQQLQVLLTKLDAQAQFISLYHHELMQESQIPKSLLAKLTISAQPLPHIMFKGKAQDAPTQVTLITASNENFTIATCVEAELTTGNESKTKSDLENHVAKLDHYSKNATFDGIKVNASSRISTVHLRFSLGLAVNGKTEVIESPLSKPFIVITHENQWIEAATKLVICEAFKGKVHIPWAQFANTLQSHFMSSTRQHFLLSDRPLMTYEMRYFHTNFLQESPNVTQQQATKFLLWFGNVERTIRFKRHVYALWSHGLIVGFLSRQQCTDAVSRQGIGVFVIRFSESQPGLFAITYCSEDPKEKVKHYLIKSEDIGSNKSLPDFLRDCECLQFILKIEPATGHVVRLAKDVALSKYYSKRKQEKAKGYVSFLG